MFPLLELKYQAVCSTKLGSCVRGCPELVRVGCRKESSTGESSKGEAEGGGDKRHSAANGAVNIFVGAEK